MTRQVSEPWRRVTKKATRSSSEKVDWVVTITLRDENDNLVRVENFPFSGDNGKRDADEFHASATGVEFA